MKNNVTSTSRRRRPIARSLLLAALATGSLAPLLRGDPNFQTGSSAQISGVMTYPNKGPDSVGNQSQVGVGDQTGPILGDGAATAQISATRSGTDASAGPDVVGTSGTSTLSASAVAQLGHLSATDHVFASSQPGGSSVFFPHADTQVNSGGPPVARFDDTTAVFNPNYAPGTSIPVSLTLDLKWTAGWDLGTTGANFAQNGATAILGVDGMGSLTDYDLERTDLAPALWSYSGPQTLNFTVANGSTFTWETFMTIFSEVAVNGLYQGQVPDPYPDVAAWADNSASIDVTPTSGLEGTIFTSNSGFVYGQQASAPGVPDSGATALLLGLGLGAATVFARRRGGKKSEVAFNCAGHESAWSGDAQ